MGIRIILSFMGLFRDPHLQGVLFRRHDGAESQGGAWPNREMQSEFGSSFLGKQAPV